MVFRSFRQVSVMLSYLVALHGGKSKRDKLYKILFQEKLKEELQGPYATVSSFNCQRIVDRY